MARLKILQFPDPRLRTLAQPVAEVDHAVRQLVADMAETMYASDGIGLAATQVDVHQQVIVIDVSAERDQLQVFINPEVEVLDSREKRPWNEGCLSVPDTEVEVVRPVKVRVRALNLQGEPFSLEPDDVLAVCIQHEMDHLKGKLMVDYLSPLKRERLRRQFKKRGSVAA